jgi:hypothetical protein
VLCSVPSTLAQRLGIKTTHRIQRRVSLRRFGYG